MDRQTGHQEDAEEFLGFFLDTLEEELLSISSQLFQNAAKHEEPTANNGWLEVGKKNRFMATRTVRAASRSLHALANCLLQIKGADSPIQRIFGGKFRSTLKAQFQRDSVTVEDWRSLRLDIQVRYKFQLGISVSSYTPTAGTGPHDQGCASVHLT